MTGIWTRGQKLFVKEANQRHGTNRSGKSSHNMTTIHSLKRSWYLGILTGVLTSAVAVGGELMGLFNCINAWVIGTAAFALILGILGSPRRFVAIGCAALFTYVVIIPYTIIHDVQRGRWDAGDSVPMFFVTFFILVILPVCFGLALDSILRTRHAINANQPGR